MTKSSILQIADNADVIISGYAFTKEGEWVRVLNLNDSSCAVVLDESGEVIETSMDDIEQGIVQGYFDKAMKYLEN